MTALDEKDVVIRKRIHDLTVVPFVRDCAPDAQFMGNPDGPMRFVDSLGFEVPTYIDPRDDLRSQYNSASAHIAIDYHVPRNLRGPYFPKDLANYDKEKHYPLTAAYKERCGGLKADGQICQKSAVNRTGFCSNHGGALHPADKMFTTARGIAPMDQSKLTRLQKVELEIVPISELMDDEIARCQVREDDGTFSKKTQLLSAKITGQMRSEFFERADRMLRESTIDMLKEMQKIALSPVEEAKDKIIAIQWLTERVLGKTPDVLLTNKTDSPFEQLYGDVMAGGTREEYRQLRGQTPNVIDGEAAPIVIDDEGDDDDSVPMGINQQVRAIEATPGLAQILADTADAEEDSISPIQQDGEEVLSQIPQGDSVGSSEPIEERAFTPLTPMELAAERKATKDRIKKARSRRFAARAQGQSTLDNLWWDITFPVQKRLIGTGTHRMKLVSPDDMKVSRMR